MTLMLAADNFPTETEEVVKFLHQHTHDDLEVIAYAPNDFAGLAAHQRQERSQKIGQSHPRYDARASKRNPSEQHSPMGTVSFESPSNEQADSYKVKEMLDRLSGQIASKEMRSVHHLRSSAQAAGAKIKETTVFSLKIQVRTKTGRLVTIAWICLPDSKWQAPGTAAVFGWYFKSQETLPGRQILKILNEWAEYFKTSGFAERPDTWASNGQLPNERWQVGYSDLPDNLETIEGWMIDVITKLRDA